MVKCVRFIVLVLVLYLVLLLHPVELNPQPIVKVHEALVGAPNLQEKLLKPVEKMKESGEDIQ